MMLNELTRRTYNVQSIIIVVLKKKCKEYSLMTLNISGNTSYIYIRLNKTKLHPITLIRTPGDSSIEFTS